MTNRNLKPWEKPANELTQFDWLTAVGLSPAHRNKPTDLRVAQEMTRFTSGETTLAWPTIQTLAEYVGCHRVSTNMAISSLRNSGALHVISIADLPDDLRDGIKRKGRGNAYGLNMKWAAEIFELIPIIKRNEPTALKRGRIQKADKVAPQIALPVTLSTFSDVATSASIDVAASATLECSGRSYANIEYEIERHRLGATNKRQLV